MRLDDGLSTDVCRDSILCYVGVAIGLHGHNNQQLALSNSIQVGSTTSALYLQQLGTKRVVHLMQGIINGFTMVDGSIMGLGRGAGNTMTEQLLCFLKNPKYDVRPIFQVIQSHFFRLRQTVEWGISIPYLISGAENEHPKEAMAWEAAGKTRDGVGFFDMRQAAKQGTPPGDDPNTGDPDYFESPKGKVPAAERITSLSSEVYRKEFFTYRPMIKVIDSTIRDGGRMCNWHFDDALVKSVYTACVEGGIDYMDIGYISSKDTIDESKVGCWRFCCDSDLRRVLGDNKTALKLAAMVEVGHGTAADIPHTRDTLIDMIRVSCGPSEVSDFPCSHLHIILARARTDPRLLSVGAPTAVSLVCSGG